MNSKMSNTKFLKRIDTLLFLSLLMMIACFFTWSENVVITRIIKVVGRMGVLVSAYFIYRILLNYGSVDSFKLKNIASPLLYIMYLTLGFISFMWSTNCGYSILQWLMTAQTFVFCYFFIKSLSLLDAYFPGHNSRLYTLLGNSVFILILTFVIGMWLMPDAFIRYTHGGSEARLGGYMMNPNELGMLAGVGIATLIFDLYRAKSKWWTLFKILILFYGLYATGSRSSLIGVLLILVFHVNHSTKKGLKAFIIVVMIFVTPIAVHQTILKGGDTERLEELMSMTGRLPFWKALISEGIPREPLLGFGFMRIDYKEYFQSTNTYPGKMTHNTFIQVLMNLGFIGLLIALAQLTITLFAIRKEPKEKKLMLFSLMIPIMINSFTEFGIFGESNFGILFYQLIIIYIAFEQKGFLTPRQLVHLRNKRPECNWSNQ